MTHSKDSPSTTANNLHIFTSLMSAPSNCSVGGNTSFTADIVVAINIQQIGCEGNMWSCEASRSRGCQSDSLRSPPFSRPPQSDACLNTQTPEVTRWFGCFRSVIPVWFIQICAYWSWSETRCGALWWSLASSDLSKAQRRKPPTSHEHQLISTAKENLNVMKDSALS